LSKWLVFGVRELYLDVCEGITRKCWFSCHTARPYLIDVVINLASRSRLIDLAVVPATTTGYGIGRTAQQVTERVRGVWQGLTNAATTRHWLVPSQCNPRCPPPDLARYGGKHKSRRRRQPGRRCAQPTRPSDRVHRRVAFVQNCSNLSPPLGCR